MKGYLKCVVENCIVAFDELCKVNKELVSGMHSDTDADVNHLGALNRMIQDYLVIRVAGLFDKNSRTISFNTISLNNSEVEKIGQEDIILKFKENRDRFVGHSDREYIEGRDFIIPTSEICGSNLKALLERLRRLL